MRSIRRSLTGYLFVLLALTLAVVWAVIDQVTARALAAREEAGGDLIRARYEERCRDERERINHTLLEQAKRLGDSMQKHYLTYLGPEWANHRRQSAAASFLFLTNPLTEAAWTATANYTPPFSRPPASQGLLFRLHLANLPLPEEFIQRLDGEHQGPDYFQVNTLVSNMPGQEWRSESMSGRKFPFDPKEIDDREWEGRAGEPGKPEAANLIDWAYKEQALDGERVWRVLYKVPYFGSPPRTRGSNPGGFGGPPGGGFGPPPPRSMVGAYAWWAAGEFRGPPPQLQGVALPPPPQPAPISDSLPKLYIFCARPQAVIDETLAQFAKERDEEIARLTDEIRQARGTLRAQVAGISLVAFLAVAVGGPILVGRGLRPVGKLSDAVSRVSERDFKLPHDGTHLASELAPIHARLTQTLDLLRRAFDREKQAVADISHELRTPIAALMATIDVALRKPRSPEQYRETLEECRLISKQLSQLVERIMTLASLDAGNDYTLVARTDATELASGCAAVVRPLATSHGLTLDLHVEEPLELDTDAGKLREVLMNLLHNAVEYNRAGGAIELVGRRDNGSVVFEVRDTGIGLTPEVRDKIFERFFRADSSRHATGVHAGLGLAIVKEYVARLGGAIAVESEPGVGSTFRVTLPAPPRDPADRADEPVTAAVR